MRYKRLLAACTLSALLSFLASCVTNPVTGKSELSLVSEEEEKQLGAESYAPMIQQSYGAASDPELQRYVQHVGESLARVSHRPGLEYQYTVVNANYDNAFALPGGKICITRGLLARMTNEDQLAGVLGHETGHVAARHSAQGMTRAILMQGALGLGTVVLAAENVKGAGLIAAAAGIGGQLVLLRHTRDQERQADELGMEYMAKSGYNPRGFVESMQILKAAHEKEPGKLEALFQSHPVTTERIATGDERLRTTYATQRDRPFKSGEFQSATRRLKDEAPAFRIFDEGEKALAAKDYRQAASRFEEASRKAPRQAILPALQGIALLEADDYAGALAASREAVRRDPSLYHGRLGAGAAAHKLGRWQESVDDLLAAEKAAGPTLLTTFMLGRDYEALGNRQEAARRYQLILQNVTSGQEYDYSRRRLGEWGYAAN